MRRRGVMSLVDPSAPVEHLAGNIEVESLPTGPVLRIFEPKENRIVEIDIGRDGACHVAAQLVFCAMRHYPTGDEAVKARGERPVIVAELVRVTSKKAKRIAADMRARLDADPKWCDPEIAGWYIWGASAWIGSGWCEEGRAPNGNENAHRERIWFSPACLRPGVNAGQIDLFSR